MNHLVMIALDRLISDVTELRAEVRELTKAIKKLHQKEDEAKRDDLLKKGEHNERGNRKNNLCVV